MNKNMNKTVKISQNIQRESQHRSPQSSAKSLVHLIGRFKVSHTHKGMEMGHLEAGFNLHGENPPHMKYNNLVTLA